MNEKKFELLVKVRNNVECGLTNIYDTAEFELKEDFESLIRKITARMEEVRDTDD